MLRAADRVPLDIGYLGPCEECVLAGRCCCHAIQQASVATVRGCRGAWLSPRSGVSRKPATTTVPTWGPAGTGRHTGSDRVGYGKVLVHSMGNLRNGRMPGPDRAGEASTAERHEARLQPSFSRFKSCQILRPPYRLLNRLLKSVDVVRASAWGHWLACVRALGSRRHQP